MELGRRPSALWLLVRLKLGCCCSSCCCSCASFGNLASSLGPIKLMFGLLRGVLLWCSSRSTSFGSVRLLLLEGWSSHCRIAVSLPWPSCRVGLGLGGLGGASVGCCWLGKAALMRFGSPLCMGQECHGNPQPHLQCLMNRDLWHELHQILLSMLLWSKAGFVPDTLCGHRGHWKYMMLGKVVVVCMVPLGSWLVCSSGCCWLCWLCCGPPARWLPLGIVEQAACEVPASAQSVV